MKDITVTAPDGKQSHLENVYIRGNMIRFVIVPDMLQQAPMFKRIGPNAMKGRGIGSARGRATILRGKFGSIYPLYQADALRGSLDILTSALTLDMDDKQHKRGVDEAGQQQVPAREVLLLGQDLLFDDRPHASNDLFLSLRHLDALYF